MNLDKLNLQQLVGENLYFLERGRSVGCDCYHTIYSNPKTDFFFMPIIGAMAIAPYGV